MIFAGLIQRETYGRKSGWRHHKRAARRQLQMEVTNTEASTMQFDGSMPLRIRVRPDDAKYSCVTDEDGVVSILSQFNDDGKRHLHASASFLAHDNAVFDCEWLEGGNHILTASGDMSIRLWDVNNSSKYINSFVGHTGSVKSVRRFQQSKDVFVSAGRDGNVLIWDTRVGVGAPGDTRGPDGELGIQPVARMSDIHRYDTSRKRKRRNVQGIPHSVTSCLVAGDDRILITGGANDGLIKFWDMRALSKPQQKRQPFYSILHPKSASTNKRYGVASMDLDTTGSRLLVGYVNSPICMYNWTHTSPNGVGSQTKMYGGTCPDTFATYSCRGFFIQAKFTPDAKHIVSGSSDGNGFIFETQGNGTPCQVLRGHMAEVSSVDCWDHRGSSQIGTVSDDGVVRVWDTQLVRRPSSPAPTPTATHETGVGEAEAEGEPSPRGQQQQDKTRQTKLEYKARKPLYTSLGRNPLQSKSLLSDPTRGEQNKENVGAMENVASTPQRPTQQDQRNTLQDFWTRTPGAPLQNLVA